MYELNELERKWISYKREKIKKIWLMAVAFSSVAVISFVISYAILAKKESNSTAATAVQKQEQNDTLSYNTDVTQLLPVCEKPLNLQKEIKLSMRLEYT